MTKQNNFGNWLGEKQQNDVTQLKEEFLLHFLKLQPIKPTNYEQGTKCSDILVWIIKLIFAFMHICDK